MLFPLQELVKFSDNIYEVTVAANRRAYQMLRIKDPLIEENEGKVVSLAVQQLFSKNVTYRIDKQYQHAKNSSTGNFCSNCIRKDCLAQKFICSRQSLFF